MHYGLRLTRNACLPTGKQYNEDGDESTYGAEACYGPHSDKLERWDLEFLGTDESPKYDPDGEMRGGDVLRGKAIWYQNREDES